MTVVCCCSSVVERILGKAEVGSSILPSSTTDITPQGHRGPYALLLPIGKHMTNPTPTNGIPRWLIYAFAAKMALAMAIVGAVLWWSQR